MLNKKQNIAQFIADILEKKIFKYQKFRNKYNRHNISNEIEKQSEKNKEGNLKFIADLSAEQRQSFKAMVALGLDSWNELSQRKKGVYITEKEFSEEHEYTGSELDGINRDKAQAELGPNFSEEQYQLWLQRQNQTNLEDNMIEDDMDVLTDDDDANRFAGD